MMDFKIIIISQHKVLNILYILVFTQNIEDKFKRKNRIFCYNNFQCISWYQINKNFSFSDSNILFLDEMGYGIIYPPTKMIIINSTK